MAEGAENPSSQNRFIYAWNNPLRFFDPDGNSVLQVVARAALVAANYIRGIDFERIGMKLLDVAKNTQNIGGRIVDVLVRTKDGTIRMAVEFKNRLYLPLTPQMDTFIKQFKDKFVLVINESTRLSEPLVKALREAGSKVYIMVVENGQAALKYVENIESLIR